MDHTALLMAVVMEMSQVVVAAAARVKRELTHFHQLDMVKSIKACQ